MYVRRFYFQTDVMKTRQSYSSRLPTTHDWLRFEKNDSFVNILLYRTTQEKAPMSHQGFMDIAKPRTWFEISPILRRLGWQLSFQNTHSATPTDAHFFSFFRPISHSHCFRLNSSRNSCPNSWLYTCSVAQSHHAHNSYGVSTFSNLTGDLQPSEDAS
jgi:hypothetical protein